jgi:hypothetical protein
MYLHVWCNNSLCETVSYEKKRSSLRAFSAQSKCIPGHASLMLIVAFHDIDRPNEKSCLLCACIFRLHAHQLRFKTKLISLTLSRFVEEAYRIIFLYFKSICDKIFVTARSSGSVRYWYCIATHQLRYSISI